MNGLALTIVVGQLPQAVRLLGRRRRARRRGRRPSSRASPTARRVPAALAVGLFALVVILAPAAAAAEGAGVLVAVVLSIVAAALLRPREHGVSLVGVLPQGFPPLTIPRVSLIRPSAAVGRARSASRWSRWPTPSRRRRAFAARTGQEVRGNQEMIGIGAANIAAGLFQGFPVSTSGSRTAVAEQAGAQTQVTGVVGAAAITLMLLLAPVAAAEPAPADAGRGRHRRLAVAGRPAAATRRLWRQRRAEFLAVDRRVPRRRAARRAARHRCRGGAVDRCNVFRRAWWPYQAVLGRVDGLAGLPRRRAATPMPSCSPGW